MTFVVGRLLLVLDRGHGLEPQPLLLPPGLSNFAALKSFYTIAADPQAGIRLVMEHIIRRR